MLIHVAGMFPDNYIYGKCTYYIWEYGEIEARIILIYAQTMCHRYIYPVGFPVVP